MWEFQADRGLAVSDSDGVPQGIILEPRGRLF